MDKHEAKQCLGILLGYTSAHDPGVKITGQTAGNIAGALKCVLEELERLEELGAYEKMMIGAYENMMRDAMSIRIWSEPLVEKVIVKVDGKWSVRPIKKKFRTALAAYQACKEHGEQSDG